MFILLVDNNRFFVSVLSEMLINSGFYNVQYIDNGLECVVQIYKGEIPDVIIIDENQCIVNGVDVLKNIRNNKPDLKIIILTGHNSPLNVNLEPERGVVRYIAKDTITAENLPKLIKTIQVENSFLIRKPNIASKFAVWRKSFAAFLNL